MVKRRAEDDASSTAKVARYLTPETIDSDLENDTDSEDVFDKSFKPPKGFKKDDAVAATLENLVQADAKDKEYWLIRVPANFNPSELDGVRIKPRTGTDFSSSSSSKRYHVASVNGQHLLALARDPKHPHVKEYSKLFTVMSSNGKLAFGPQFQEQLVVSEQFVDIPAPAKPMYKPKQVVQPDALHQRFVPFGAGFADIAAEENGNGNGQASDDDDDDEVTEIQTPSKKDSRKDKKDKKDKKESKSDKKRSQKEKDRKEKKSG